jgi:arsenite methyltransferase
MSSSKIDYGIDAPGLVRFFLMAGFVSAICAVLAILIVNSSSLWVLLIKLLFATAAIYLLGMGGLMLYWSKFTKARMRESTLDLVSWRGNERVLDVGCGRGLMLIGAAKRLTTGQAVGIDIWEAKDQSSNSLQAVLENVRIAGVQNRVEVHTADCRSLSFSDQSFDIVVSHWVVHNLPSEEERNRAISEMVRILRPDGRLILCDIEHRNTYITTIRLLGLKDPKMIFGPVADVILGALSFGSFRPTTIIATKVV